MDALSSCPLPSPPHWVSCVRDGSLQFEKIGKIARVRGGLLICSGIAAGRRLNVECWCSLRRLRTLFSPGRSSGLGGAGAGGDWYSPAGNYFANPTALLTLCFAPLAAAAKLGQQARTQDHVEDVVEKIGTFSLVPIILHLLQSHTITS